MIIRLRRRTLVNSKSVIAAGGGKPRGAGFDSLIAWAAAVLVFFVSRYLLGLYVGGDQIHYNALYMSAFGLSLSELYVAQQNYVGGAEPVYTLIIWLGVFLDVPKDVYISVFNSIFAGTLVAVLRAYRASWIFIALIFLNFYFLVLLTSAERLKFGYMFLVLGAMASGWLRWTFIAAAPLAHFQIIALYLSSLIGHIARSGYAVGLRWNVRGILMALGILLIVAAVVVIFSAPLQGKFEAHHGVEYGVDELLQWSLLLGCAMIIFGFNKTVLLTFAIFVPALVMLGGSRVNMILFTAFLILVVEARKSNHPVVLVLLLYFAFRGFDFVYNVYQFGDGFANF